MTKLCDVLTQSSEEVNLGQVMRSMELRRDPLVNQISFRIMCRTEGLDIACLALCARPERVSVLHESEQL